MPPFDMNNYILCACGCGKPKHPLANGRGEIQYHRYIAWEAGLLKTLTDVVHHIDGNIKNNEINNLQVLTGSEHAKLHSPGKAYWKNYYAKIQS